MDSQPTNPAPQSAPQYTTNEPNPRPAAHQGAPSHSNNDPESRPAAHHDAPSYAPAHHQNLYCKTNPPPPKPLTPAQLTAIRYLLQGHRPGLIAACLKIDRHTLLRWRNSPQFQQELLSLHRQLLNLR